MAGNTPLRFKLPHEFFPPKPQEHDYFMEDENDDHISDVSSHCCYCSSDCSLRVKPHEFFLPTPQEHNHPMEDHCDDDHISHVSSHSCSCCSDCFSDSLNMNVDHLPYSKRSNSSMIAQAPGSPHQSDPAEDQLLHTTATNYDYDHWSAYVQLHDHSSQHTDNESEGGYNSYKLRSPSHYSTALEGATTPHQSYQSENDSDSDDSCFSLPSWQYSSPLPTTPYIDPDSYYGPFSPTNSPTAVTLPLYDCNRCFEMARKPVVTSCGHVYCLVCLYEWLNCDNGKECVACMRNLCGSFITPIRSSVKSAYKEPPRASQKEHLD